MKTTYFNCNSCGQKIKQDEMMIRKQDGAIYCDECWADLDGEFEPEDNYEKYGFHIIDDI